MKKIIKTNIHLNVHRKWYNMLASGEKPEEYREMKPYWNAFLARIDTTKVETITFSNGYHQNRSQMVIECKAITSGNGNPKWGAVAGEKYHIFKLGKIITKNHK